ncbi:MAG TPA: ATP-dependent RecD-like DNA helicase [Verrucomicrobiota bacterium]|nr:ATP-dependent RecD-like DNA helicase [Verrucomicrobiota bacterium]
MRPRLAATNSGPGECVDGLIERVTFHNEENGFSVLRVKAKGHRDLVTVVGCLPAVTAGEWLSAEGNWVRDREHGLQFKAVQLRCVPPSTREGIEKYLASGMIKGIGPVYAKKLVAYFGDTVFDVIDQYSARLEEVDGIGPMRRRRIKAAWTEQKVVREIMVFLHTYGAGTSRALRIYKKYGEQAIEKLRANPYCLAADITGIGFKTADRMADRLGIAADSFLRICAALNHLLLEATNEGHCALPIEDLISRSLRLLNEPRSSNPQPVLAQSQVQAALEQLLARRELTLETIGDIPLVFHPVLQRAETIIAEIIHILARQPSRLPDIDLAKAISWCETKTGKSLAPSQREALIRVFGHPIVIMTGGPGVGKTTLVDALLRILQAKKVRCLLCAPTGRAAKRLTETTGLPASTIHRLLKQRPGQSDSSSSDRPALQGDLIVVDETSMVDVPLMSRLLQAVPNGAHLLLVGDVDQLPSVGPGTVLRDLIESRVAPVMRLTEVFRQAAGSRIITTAHAIRNGCLPEQPTGDELSDFYFIEREDPAAIHRSLLELVTTRIPRKFNLDPIRDIQVLSPMNRGALGVVELNRILQEQLNPASDTKTTIQRFGWQFRVGDKVIQTENNYDKEVFNGDIGILTAIDPIEQEATVDFDGRPVTYDFGELDEVSLAYAMTIHKSQGSEFPAVVIPLATQHYLLLQRNLIYTGITRGKRLVVLIGQRRAFAMAVRNDHSEHRYGGLLSRLQTLASP